MTDTHEHRQHYNVTFALLALAGCGLRPAPSRSSCRRSRHDRGGPGTTAGGGAWIITAYLLSASVATPIAGRFGDMFGKKRDARLVLVLLALGTLISALATTRSG